MACSANFLECIVEGFEFWVLQLGVVEAEEVVHDDVAGECGEGMGQV